MKLIFFNINHQYEYEKDVFGKNIANINKDLNISKLQLQKEFFKKDGEQYYNSLSFNDRIRFNIYHNIYSHYNIKHIPKTIEYEIYRILYNPIKKLNLIQMQLSEIINDYETLDMLKIKAIYLGKKRQEKINEIFNNHINHNNSDYNR